MIAQDIFASGGANAITPLSSLISAGDEVHGLSGATYVNYNSRGITDRGTAPASVDFTSGSFANQGLADMRTCFNNASEGMIQPDVILTEYATHERYEGALQPQERYAGTATTADAGFTSLLFKGKPVISDPNVGSGDLYMLSLDSDEGVRLHALSGADFDFGEWKPAATQPVMVRPLYLTCELMIGNRKFGCNKLDTISD